jgi:predicted permease
MMRWIYKFPLRLRSLFRKSRVEQELSDELRFHLEKLIEEKVAKGMTPEEARYAALREIGGVEQIKEECRDMRRVNYIENFLQDVRYGLRQLRRSPGFTAVAVLTLALGIGANTAIFTLIDAVMLKTLPVGRPGELVILKWTARDWPKADGYSAWGPCPHPANTPSGCSFPYSAFQQFHSASHVLSGVLAAAGPEQLTALANGHAAFARGELVSGDFFSTLRVPAMVGRTLEPEDDKAAAPPVAVISYGYWMGRFGGDSSVVGKSLVLNSVPFTVVGVAAPRFTGLQPGLPAALWLPLAHTPLLYPQWGGGYTSPTGRVWWLWVVGRLKAGVSAEHARAALGVMFSQSVTSGPKPAFTPEDKPGIQLTSASTGLGFLQFFFAEPLFLLMAVVGLVLLIACANLANLLLARATGRQREIATRMALGAGPWRLTGQLLIESLLLAGMGGAAGLLLAWWGSRSSAAFISTGWFGPLSLDVNLDYRVLAFTAAVSILTGLLFGLAPALHGTRLDLTAALKASPGSLFTAAQHRRRGLLRNALIVWQVALAVPLLIGTGLFVRTLVKLESVDLGFNPRNVLLFDLAPGLSGYKDERPAILYDELLQRLKALPGVISATLTQHALVSGSLDTGNPWMEGHSSPTSTQVDILRVGPGFLETMGIPLLAGRAISRQDLVNKQQVALINRAMARRYFPNENPLGRHFGWDREKASEYEIVGIVGDTKYDDLRKVAEPTIYLPQTGGFSTFELRTAGDPKALIPSVRSVVEQVDRNLPIDNVRTQSEQIKQSLFQERLLAGLCSLFAGLALVLACVGLYGVVSYGVAQRTNEIGIRMALGAERRDVLKMVLRQGLAPTLAGLALGLVVAAGVSRLLTGFLYEVRPTDPVTYVCISLLLAAVALLATYFPARRATKVDPMVALRYE